MGDGRGGGREKSEGSYESKIVIFFVRILFVIKGIKFLVNLICMELFVEGWFVV